MLGPAVPVQVVALNFEMGQQAVGRRIRVREVGSAFGRLKILCERVETRRADAVHQAAGIGRLEGVVKRRRVGHFGEVVRLLEERAAVKRPPRGQAKPGFPARAIRDFSGMGRSHRSSRGPFGKFLKIGQLRLLTRADSRQRLVTRRSRRR